MPDPTKFMYPCNCFGTTGQFELDQEFHEMGIAGCNRKTMQYYTPDRVFEGTHPVPKERADAMRAAYKKSLIEQDE